MLDLLYDSHLELFKMAVNLNRKFDDSAIFLGVLLIVGGDKLQNMEDPLFVILAS